MRFALILIALLAFPVTGSAQVDPNDVGDGCQVCHLTGVKECKKHPSNLKEVEKQVLYCSVATSCEDCKGALLVDCKKCAGGPGNVEMETLQLRAQRFHDNPTPPEILFNRELVRIVTPHFDIIIDSEKIKDGSNRMSAHEVAHALATEAEKAANLLDEQFGAKVHHYAKRSRLWFWGDPKDHLLVNQKVLGNNDQGAFKLFGPDPAYSAWSKERGLGNKGMAIVSNGVHVSIHLLLSNLFRTEWIGNKKAGWFDVGAAHYYENKRFQQITTYCIDEADANLDWENGRWYVPVRKYLTKHKKSVLPGLLSKISGTMWGEEHALSWSLYDWVASVHPEALKPLLLGYKDRKQSRELFKKHLGMSILQVETAWRAWVSDTYPVKNPKPRKKL